MEVFCTPRMKKICSFRRQMSDWLRNGFVLSKTVVFIWGLILSHALVKKAVVSVLVDFLADQEKYSLREAAMVVNLLVAVSAISEIVFMHVSEAYTARFNVIIFCTGAYVMGLMLLWVYSLSKYLPLNERLLALVGGPGVRTSPLNTFIIALVLIALGRAGGDPILSDFFDNQLTEKVKKKFTENEEGKDKELSAVKERSNENRTGAGNLWPTTATFGGAAIAVFGLGDASWPTTFKISSLVMGAMNILFFFGIICYCPEERPKGSPFTTIYMVFKAAIKKRSLPYPDSKEGYYSNNNNQGPDDSECRPYPRENGKFHLLPHHPSFLLVLDKAAIIRNDSDAEREQRNGEPCAVEQVREVKCLYSIVVFGFTFFAYSLVSASAYTYFVEQTSNLNYKVGNFDVPIMVFFVLKSSVAFMVNTIQSKKLLVKPIWIIAIALICSILCSFAAWLVERHRLFLIRKEGVLESENPDEVIIPLSIMVLAPQYFLLGLMEGFAEAGLMTFVFDRVAQSVRTIVNLYFAMMEAIGAFSSILSALIFRSWFNESINTSHMDWYFLLLALLNCVFFGIYLWYALSKGQESERKNTEISSTSLPREEPHESEVEQADEIEECPEA